jgi:molybdate transport system permease protein
MDLVSLWVTVKLAAVVTPLLLALTLPLTAALAFTRFPGRGLVEATCALPLVLPPTVLGFVLLAAMGPHGPVGRAWEWLTGGRLVFTFTGLVAASMVYSLPFAVQPVKAAFARIDPRLLESAQVLGLTRTATFFRVILPNTVGGIAAAAVLVFAHTMGEFGVALMVGGSIPGVTKVASIAIFEQVENLEYGRAAVLSALLLPVSYAVLLLAGRLGRE